MDFLLQSLINDLDATANYARANNLGWQAELFERHAQSLRDNGDVPPRDGTTASLQKLLSKIEDASTDEELPVEVEQKLEAIEASLEGIVAGLQPQTTPQEHLLEATRGA